MQKNNMSIWSLYFTIDLDEFKVNVRPIRLLYSGFNPFNLGQISITIDGRYVGFNFDGKHSILRGKF